MDKNMIFQVPLTYIGMVHLWLFVLYRLLRTNDLSAKRPYCIYGAFISSFIKLLKTHNLIILAAQPNNLSDSRCSAGRGVRKMDAYLSSVRIPSKYFYRLAGSF